VMDTVPQRDVCAVHQAEQGCHGTRPRLGDACSARLQQVYDDHVHIWADLIGRGAVLDLESREAL